MTDDVSAARLRFCRRCGFAENPYPHRHPPYREGRAPHPLAVFICPLAMTEAECLSLAGQLARTVMNGA